MSFDGNGNFLRIMNWQDDAAAGIKIKSDRHDQQDNDFASGLSNAITRDGQSQPTNHIPMNGKRLTNLGDPTVDTDAVNKKYVDAIQTFGTKLDLSGADANGRVNFTSSTGANGFTWTGADLSWLARIATVGPPATLNRLVLNDKVDGTGTDMIEMRDNGSALFRGVVTSTTFMAKAATGNVHLWFLGPNDEQRGIIYTNAAAAGAMNFQVAGVTGVFTMNTDGHFYLPSQAVLYNNGNIGGGPSSIWKNFSGGHADAYTAINAQIEARAQAWAINYANACVQNTQMAGEVVVGYNTQSGTGGKFQNSGYVCTATEKPGGNNLNFYFRQPQRYIPNIGWAAAYPF